MKTVSFNGVCSARSTVVLTTPRITHPYKIVRIHCRFPVGCINELRLRFYTSPDDDVPSSGPPNGVSMLREYGHVDYVVGDGDSKSMDHDLDVAESNSWLKVYAVNDDYYDHAVDVQMTLEPKKRG